MVTPAPCAANAAVPQTLARRNLLSLDPISSPYRDYGMVLFRHLWRWVWGVGVRPRRVRPVLTYPGSGRGRPASVRSSPILAVLTTHTLPTIIACANGTALPFPAPLPIFLVCMLSIMGEVPRVWLWLKISVCTGPHLATSKLAPAPA